MESDGNSPVPGWYTDPRGESALRWWNGRAWTEQTAQAPGGGAFTPPVIPGAQPAAQSSPPARQASPPPQERAAVVASAGQPTLMIGGRLRPLAAWWPRAGAFIVDNLIVLALILPFIIIAGVVVAGIDWTGLKFVDGQLNGISADDRTAVGLAALILASGSLLISLTYQPLTMARRGAQNGRTWGMQALGVRVVRNDGQPMTYGHALVRQFLVMGLLYGVIQLVGNGFTVVGGTLAVLLAYLWPLRDKENRAWQDLICSTHVVRD